MNIDIIDIQEKTGYKFKNWELMFQAFTHSSYANERGEHSNERLEFLGDSVVNYVTADYLYKKYPDKDEGFLTKVRAQIVSAKTLSKVVDCLDIIKYMRTGAGADVMNSTNKKCDLFEAVTGAITLDGGLEEGRRFALEKLKHYLERDYQESTVSDYKSHLLELSKKKNFTVEFHYEKAGTQQADDFIATVYINKEARGTGQGASKIIATQTACKLALETIEIK